MPVLFAVGLAVSFMAFAFLVARKAKHTEVDDIRLYRVPVSIAALFLLVPAALSFALVVQILPEARDKVFAMSSVGAILALGAVGSVLLWRNQLRLGPEALQYRLARWTTVRYGAVQKLVLKRDRVLAIHHDGGRVLEVSRLLGDFDDLVTTLRGRCPGAAFQDTRRRRTLTGG